MINLLKNRRLPVSSPPGSNDQIRNERTDAKLGLPHFILAFMALAALLVFSAGIFALENLLGRRKM